MPAILGEPTSDADDLQSEKDEQRDCQEAGMHIILHALCLLRACYAIWNCLGKCCKIQLFPSNEKIPRSWFVFPPFQDWWFCFFGSGPGGGEVYSHHTHTCIPQHIDDEMACKQDISIKVKNILLQTSDYNEKQILIQM